MNKDIIKLQIPKKSEYISVARLAISGIAYGIDADIGNIEDLKVCIGEACINALAFSKSDELDIEFEVKRDKIIIRVKEVNGCKEDDSDDICKELKLGMLIIESLMDKVIIDNTGIEMIKHIEVDAK